MMNVGVATLQTNTAKSSWRLGGTHVHIRSTSEGRGQATGVARRHWLGLPLWRLDPLKKRSLHDTCHRFHYFHRLDRAFEAITHPWLGQNVARSAWDGFDLLTQVSDVRFHQIRVACLFPAPDMGDDLLQGTDIVD